MDFPDIFAFSMQWYYSKGSVQLGPIPEAELFAKLISGEVSATERVWKEGMADWLPAARVPEFSAAAVLPSATESKGVENSPYAPPAVPSGMVPSTALNPPTSGLAIASLVCGIIGLVTCFLPGIAAVICGHMALNRMADPSVRVGGRGMAIAGLVLGYLSILVLVALVILMAIGAAYGGLK